MTTWLAPAKLNLFLHVVGQRADGYHLLQTVFQFIDFYDELEFSVRSDSGIHQAVPIDGISEDQNLAILAAKRLQQYTDCKKGADISIIKKIPMGAGLGGGSSNAATTLLALNQLWQLGLGRKELAQIGLEIGADVPVFVQGWNAWAEGLGEELTPIELDSSHFIVIIPPIHVATVEIFSNPKLTRDAKPIKIRDFLAGSSENQMQPVTCELYPQVQQVVDWLGNYGEPQMSGSGAAVFIRANSAQKAEEIVKECPSRWQAIYAKGLTKHPHG